MILENFFEKSNLDEPSKKKIYLLNHSPIDFYFVQNSDNFVVEEIPLYEFSGSGEHTILKIRKKNISTNELIRDIASTLGIKSHLIGYAGLKDKSALTTQYISVPKECEKSIKKIETPQIKIVDMTYHNNKLRIGHLKGNRFFIRVKKLSKYNALKISNVLAEVSKFGVSNYFGYQRFGRDGDNHIEGKKIAQRETKFRDKKRAKFLASSYQSYLFNNWLAKRLELSKIVSSLSLKEIEEFFGVDSKNAKLLKSQEHPFKLLNGDIACHYPYGKNFYIEQIGDESHRFAKGEISPTGILCGKKAQKSSSDALLVESRYIDESISEIGSRRFAIIFPQELSFEYKEEKAWGEFSFCLPKGCYATNFLEEIAAQELFRE